MTTSAWALSVRKELRALLPALVASVGVIAAAPVIWAPGERPVIVLAAYAIGALAIGAVSVGHEYTYRTLSLVLIRPISRRAVLGAKAFAVALALALLVVAVVMRLPSKWPWPESITVQAALILPLVGAIAVAPWLTMVCRSTLAGMVFTAAVPMMVSLAASAALAVRYGAAVPAWADKLPFQLFLGASIVLAIVGTVTGWRQFMVLEAIDGPGTAVAPPAWLTGDRRRSGQEVTRRLSVWPLLVAKELRLQQMSFVLAALFAVGFGAFRLMPMTPDAFSRLGEVVATLYAAVLVVLIGALACAEEHRLGTVAWQVLLPVSARRQWAVKVAVVLTLSIVLGCLLPAVLFAAADGETRLHWHGEVIAIVALASCAALYLSSISKDGLRAAILAPIVIAGAIPLGAAGTLLGFVTTRLALPYADAIVGRWAPEGFSSSTYLSLIHVDQYITSVTVTGFAVLLLHAAFQNYRTGGWNARRVGSQVARAMALLAGSLVLAALVNTVRLDSSLRTMWASCRQPGGQCASYVQDGPPFAKFTDSFRLSRWKAR